MTAKKQTRQNIDLPRLLTVQVVGFVMFHLNQQILFTVSFERMIQNQQWIGNFVATYGSWTWLFGPMVIYLWWALRASCNRPLVLGFAAITFYCAYQFQYPVLTSFLTGLGQFERFPLWMMGHVPTGAEIFDL